MKEGRLIWLSALHHHPVGLTRGNTAMANFASLYILAEALSDQMIKSPQQAQIQRQENIPPPLSGSQQRQ